MDRKARVGMLGCASIGRKNTRAIMKAKNAELVAVASRDLAKCEKYCEDCKLPPSVARLGSYDALLSDESIDIVYIPLPTTTHLEWVTKVAEAKKHVLVEKPVGVNADQVKEMILACRKAGVQMMDGVMFMHHARFAKMREIFDDPTVWEPQRVTSAFSFKATGSWLDAGNIRVRADADPLGCLGDLGWYNVRIGLAAFGWRKPEAVVARLRAETAEGVPLDMDVDVIWPGGDGVKPKPLLTFHCSFMHTWAQWYEASSEDGKAVRCRDFVIPKREQTADFEVEHAIGCQDMDTATVADTTVVPTTDCIQEVRMFERMADIALSKQTEPFWEEVSLLTQAIMDAALASARDGGARVPVACPDL